MEGKRHKPMTKTESEVYMQHGFGNPEAYVTMDFDQLPEAQVKTYDRLPDSIRLIAKYKGRVPQSEWEDVAPGSRRLLEKRSGVPRAEGDPVEEDEMVEVVVRNEQLSDAEEDYSEAYSSDEIEYRNPQPVEWRKLTPAELETKSPFEFIEDEVEEIQELEMQLSNYVDEAYTHEKWKTLMERQRRYLL